MQFIQNVTDVCLSGGAEGADIEWGSCAESVGHLVIHWSFPGHESAAPECRIVRLSDEQLKLGDEALRNAASALGKSAPRRPAVVRLLQRNYYQVAWSQACYAVTTIRDGTIPGGTAWAITMFIQLHSDNHDLYVFDQEKNAWFEFNGKTWDKITLPPCPSGVWAGIGSRDLKPNGREAIRTLLSPSTTQLPNSANRVLQS